MLDPFMRRRIGPPLDLAGAWLAGRGVTPNAVSVTGLAIGLSAVPLLAFGHYGAALVAILLNRLLDGLDGAVARHRPRLTAFGGYLDIVCDMVFYAAVPLGFALARPENAVWAAILLASFVCTCASFLGRAVLAASRRGKRHRQEGTQVLLPCGGPDRGHGDDPGLRSFLPSSGHFPLARRGGSRPMLLDGRGPCVRRLPCRIKFLIFQFRGHFGPAALEVQGHQKFPLDS